MENQKLVLPGHLNHYGYLFGGYLLQWVDECSWISATLEFPGCNLVTVAMDKVEFKKSVRQGTILTFRVNRVKQGTSSVKYRVTVIRDNVKQGNKEEIFSTNVTFVRVDEDGNKIALPSSGDDQ